MTSTIFQRLDRILLVGGLTVLAVGLSSGCAQTKNKKVDSRYELQLTVLNFHRDLRWEEFERAATIVHPSYRQVFMGRYEEHGDDLDIVGLEVKKVTPDSVDTRRVEVEQKWLVEPDMTVKKKRFVEIWKRTDAGWMLRERMRKTEWKRRQKAELENAGESEAEKKQADAKPDAGQ